MTLNDSSFSPDTIELRHDARRIDSSPGKLIVVSNRVALPDEAQAGGLGQALRALLVERGGVWVGWSGKSDTGCHLHREHAGRVEYLTLDLPAEEFDPYYKEYANGALWPLLHGRVDLVTHTEEGARGYEAINARFADLISRIAGSDDLIWVQDYHLIPLASLLRARGVRCRIGFFLHTPMPSADIFEAMPGHEKLLDGFAAYDVVGLQTSRDCRALRDLLVAGAKASIAGADALEFPDGRVVTVRAFPIGVDVDGLVSLADAALELPAVASLATDLANRQLIVGVDRLDYSKGLPQRIAAYSRLLDQAPEWRRGVTFLQVAPESRSTLPEYAKLSRNVQRRVGALNGRHGDESWTPLRYVNRTYAHDTLAGFYRLARVGLVTPLRDGMNLVAKEFLACQSAADPGVLVLSKFAGAARELDSALLVNPHDPADCASALLRALTMAVDERRERWAAAMQVLRASTVHDWGRTFMDALERAPFAESENENVRSPIGERIGRLLRRQRRVQAVILPSRVKRPAFVDNNGATVCFPE